MISEIKDVSCRSCLNPNLERIEQFDSYYSKDGEVIVWKLKCKQCGFEQYYVISSDSEIT